MNALRGGLKIFEELKANEEFARSPFFMADLHERGALLNISAANLAKQQRRPQ